MRIRTIVLLLLLSLSLLTGLFFSTNPESIAVGFLVLPIVLLFLCGYFSSLLFMRVMRMFSDKAQKQHMIAIFGGLIVVFWVIVQSAGGATLGDVILLGIISAIVLFYITKY